MQQRKTNKLQKFDYSQNGAYFVTICSKGKQHIFGEVVDENKINSVVVMNEQIVGAGIDRPSIILSSIGKIIENSIQEIPRLYENITVEKYVIIAKSCTFKNYNR